VVRRVTMGGLHAAWIALSKVGWMRLALVGLIGAPRLLIGRQPAGEALASPAQQRVTPKVTLRHTSKRFAACMSKDDVNVPNFIAAANDFVSNVEQFGDFTKRGVTDARKNLRRVEQAGGGRIRSMRQLLRSELQRGARRSDGGPASSTGAEALLWSRLSISLWVEIFKEYLGSRNNRPSLADATRSGFRRSMGRYFDRFGQAAFHAAAGRTPGWMMSAGERTSAATTASAARRVSRRS